MTVNGFSLSSSAANSPSSVSSTQKVCWFKVSAQPTAKFDFDMCTNKKCEWQRGGGQSWYASGCSFALW